MKKIWITMLCLICVSIIACDDSGDDKNNDIAIKGKWLNSDENISITCSNTTFSVIDNGTPVDAEIVEYNNDTKQCIVSWEEDDNRAYELIKWDFPTKTTVNIYFNDDCDTVEEARASGTTNDDPLLFTKQ